MRTLTYYILGFMLLISIFSCKKESLPEPENTEPEFYFSGDINGVNTKYEAGKNDYYMYSGFNQDANNVYNFDSHLNIVNCNNCPNGIEVIVKDYQASAVNSSITFTNSISAGYYPFEIIGGASISNIINFTALSSGGLGVDSVQWNFGDGSSITTSTTTTNHTYNRPGFYTVCITTKFNDLSTSTICNEVKVEIPNNSCYAIFNSTSPSGNLVNFTAVPIFGTPPYTYFWDFGDGNNFTSSSTAATHTYATSGTYLTCLKVTDATGSVSNFCRYTNTNGINTSITTFTYTSGGAIPNPLSLSNVIIKYTASNGLVYTTLDAGGQSGSYFKVISVNDYINNENGLPTKKVRLQFKCKLYNSTNTLQLDNGEAIIAIAYKN